ncbi:ANTAR domain-containing response regulator [Chelatococcus sp. GCM10030263]|uniref:ANTAR domain-containing response regulator n=1 Tax=Chelatococcus sp. GCM10030263 TaxID=3273387 RepID=UPI00361005E0
MTAPRLLQNFSGGRAHIVTASPGAVEALEATLVKLGVGVEHVSIVEGRAVLDIATLQADRDILFVDGDLDGVLAIEPDFETRLPPVPIIGLVGVEAPSRLKALTNLGATGFLRKPVHGATVYTTLFLGINQFLLRSDLGHRLRELERRRQGRRSVVKAIVALMRQAGCDDDEAYAVLRRESMRSRQNLEDYCEEFLKKKAGSAAFLTQQAAAQRRIDQA